LLKSKCQKLFVGFVSRVLPAFKDTNKKHKLYAIIKLEFVKRKIEYQGFELPIPGNDARKRAC
jgi:hypothetical protein